MYDYKTDMRPQGSPHKSDGRMIGWAIFGFFFLIANAALLQYIPLRSVALTYAIKAVLLIVVIYYGVKAEYGTDKPRLAAAAAVLCIMGAVNVTYNFIDGYDLSLINFQLNSILHMLSPLLAFIAYILMGAAFVDVSRRKGEQASKLFLWAGWLFFFRSFPSGVAFGIESSTFQGFDVMTPIFTGIRFVLSSLMSSIPFICVTAAMREYCRRYLKPGAFEAAPDNTGVIRPGMTAVKPADTYADPNMLPDSAFDRSRTSEAYNSGKTAFDVGSVPSSGEMPSFEMKKRKDIDNYFEQQD